MGDRLRRYIDGVSHCMIEQVSTDLGAVGEHPYHRLKGSDKEFDGEQHTQRFLDMLLRGLYLSSSVAAPHADIRQIPLVRLLPKLCVSQTVQHVPYYEPVDLIGFKVNGRVDSTFFDWFMNRVPDRVIPRL